MQMTEDSVPRRVLRRIGYFSAGLSLFGVVTFLSVGIATVVRARRLRNDICRLHLGESTFDEVSRIFPRYEGYVRTHDALPQSCSLEGCSYVLYAENPILKVIPIFPRTGFYASVRISENVLKARSLGIAQARGQRYREAFVQQATDSHFKEDTHIITESEMPRKGVAVPFENSALFVQLTNELRLSCLVVPGIWSEPDDMLPYLRDKKTSRDAVATH
jgi:hypothetical protein